MPMHCYGGRECLNPLKIPAGCGNSVVVPSLSCSRREHGVPR